jgi:hypothetical protein
MPYQWTVDLFLHALQTDMLPKERLREIRSPRRESATRYERARIKSSLRQRFFSSGVGASNLELNRPITSLVNQIYLSLYFRLNELGFPSLYGDNARISSWSKKSTHRCI